MRASLEFFKKPETNKRDFFMMKDDEQQQELIVEDIDLALLDITPIEEKKLSSSSNFHSLFSKSKDEILKELLAHPIYDSGIEKPWYLDNDVDSRYPIGQVVPYSTDEYRMKKYQSVMYVVKDFGTSHPVFTRKVYSHSGVLPYWSPHRPQIRGDGELRTYSMHQEEIDEFSLKITQSSFSLKC